MSIAALKRNYEEKLRQIISDPNLNYPYKKSDLTISTRNDEIALRDKKQRTVLSMFCDESFERFNHLAVSFQFFYRYHGNEYAQEVSDVYYPFYYEVFKVMRNYWFEYSTLVGKSGMFILGHKKTLDKEIRNKLQKEWIPNEVKTFSELLNNRYRMLVYEIVSIHTSAAFIERANLFSEKAASFEKVLELEPTIHLKIYNTLDLFEPKPISIHYSGVDIITTLSEDMETFSFSKPDGSETLIDNDVNCLLTYFRELKEENKLKNLIEKPLYNFQKFILRFLQSDYNIANEAYLREFEKMEKIFGSWEETEEFFAVVTKEISNKTIQSCYSFIESERKTEVKVYHLPVKNKHLYIISGQFKTFNSVNSYRSNNFDSYKDFQIILSNEESFEEAKRAAADFLFWSR